MDEETVGRGLSNLGRSADGSKQVYLHCTVPVSENYVLLISSNSHYFLERIRHVTVTPYINCCGTAGVLLGPDSREK